MSRKKRPAIRRANARQPTVQENQPIPVQDKAVRTNDSFSNPFARLGFGQPNLLEAAEYPTTRMTQNYPLLNSLYRNDWIATKIIDVIPEDMTKNWYRLTSQVQPDKMEELATLERRTHIRRRILEGLRWGRLFGGAAGIMVIEGQENMLEEPLDLNLIMPGQFKGLIIADRWSGVYPDSALVQGISDPDFGTPEFYNFSMSETEIAYGIRVHHSRVVRFTGRELPYVERISESYWGMSELEHVYTELNKRNTSSANIAQLIFQANIRTYKMNELGEMLVATDAKSQRDLYQTLMMQNFLMSNMGMNVMDKEDDFVTNQYTFSGLNDIYESFMLDIAGAAEIPVTKLFGRSPAGMNATGESDLINYYDKVKQQQEAILRPILEKLLPIMCLSTWGVIPDDLKFEFNPIRDSSESERADLMSKYTGAVIQAYQANVVSQKVALKELRQTSSFTGAWTNITDEDIENADDDTNPMFGAEGFPNDPLAGIVPTSPDTEQAQSTESVIAE